MLGRHFDGTVLIDRNAMNVCKGPLSRPWRGGFDGLDSATSGHPIGQRLASPTTGFKVQLP